jgi:ADP-ribose pyrophosphatase
MRSSIVIYCVKRDNTHMSDSQTKNKWICLSEKLILHSSVMDLIERNCKSSEDERLHRFYLLKSRDWCNIIPITADGKVVMVRQYRVGVSQHTLEFPGGIVDPTDANIQAAALREMTEETGYMPLDGAKCLPLQWFFPNPAILDNRCFGFVVGPVHRNRKQNLDPGEMIETIEVPIHELPQRINQGDIRHCLMLTSLLFLLLHTEEGSLALRNRLDGFTRI